MECSECTYVEAFIYIIGQGKFHLDAADAHVQVEGHDGEHVDEPSRDASEHGDLSQAAAAAPGAALAHLQSALVAVA